jgi:hypothetical protein
LFLVCKSLLSALNFVFSAVNVVFCSVISDNLVLNVSIKANVSFSKESVAGSGVGVGVGIIVLTGRSIVHFSLSLVAIQRSFAI